MMMMVMMMRKFSENKRVAINGALPLVTSTAAIHCQWSGHWTEFGKDTRQS